jgi:hypothetical protein
MVKKHSVRLIVKKGQRGKVKDKSNAMTHKIILYE